MEKKKTAIRSIICLTLGTFFLCSNGAENLEKEIISKEKTLNWGNYQISINKHGKIVECKKENTIIMKDMGLMAYPADKSGRLFQGGASNECCEKEIEATTLCRENDNFIVRKKAFLGNREHPELIKYRQEIILSPENTIEISYEIEYMETLKWLHYGTMYPVIIPIKLISGKGWVAEMKKGECVRAGLNPDVYNKADAVKWIYIDNGSMLRLETELGEIKISAAMPSFLRGGIEGNSTGIYVISMPRDPLIETGSSQSIKFKIILP